MPDRDKSQILTLRRLLEPVADADRRVEVAIETKHPTRYAGLVERRLVALLDEFGWAARGPARSPVRVMSFSQTVPAPAPVAGAGPAVGDAVRAGAAALPRRQPPRGAASPARASRSCAPIPRYVERAHRRGHPVHVWTVDDADDIELCAGLGVEAIITNRPRPGAPGARTRGRPPARLTQPRD